ncbi:DUF2218 domain-containing protein [Roseibium polysiphoniae]|uniref:DUF2218 domain-containing protein n=1 Tax=Roseibium polysiphoniae TaxID=2571221 RepID=A0ABR9C4G5_9HYPH|nr:DUF2218 domain-containing protein [Roseibium polysiphoniae]MBD8874722.1 DUF2218 domain-containing protein [Roseibium polysiphoniae]
MIVVTSTAHTASASKYLQQLCKHFAHKVPADWDANKGEVSFPFGFCQMFATDASLTIRCEADEDQSMARMKGVIDSHIERFAWREELKLEWRPTA